jgi:hypothetical protein
MCNTKQNLLKTRRKRKLRRSVVVKEYRYCISFKKLNGNDKKEWSVA